MGEIRARIGKMVVMMPGGRPPIPSEVYDEILERVAKGEFLREIERIPGMPNITTVWRKIQSDSEFSKRYARAREMQSHAHAERAVMAAREATPETATVARVQFDAERWMAGKLAPKVYGDKVTQEIQGADGKELVGITVNIDPVAAANMYQKLIKGS